MAEGLKAEIPVCRADAGIVDAAERQTRMAVVHGGKVDADAAGRGAGDDLLCESRILLEDVESQRLRPRVDAVNHLVQPVIGHDRQNRAEDLLAVDVHLRRDRLDQRRRNIGALRLAAEDDPGTLVRCILKQAAKALGVVSVDDAGIIAARLRIRAIGMADRCPQRL